MLQTLVIAFREGLEALLIVAMAALYLRRTGREALVSGRLRAGGLDRAVVEAPRPPSQPEPLFPGHGGVHDGVFSPAGRHRPA